ncbi:MAG: IS4 family transposase [Hyphomicrobium sp.]
MRHHNSLFHQVLQVVPWDQFERLVDGHGSDARVRRLTSKSQLIALLYAQLSGAESLREIEQSLSSHAGRLYHLGATVPARSTLADANAKRPAQLFADLFAVLTAQASTGLRRTTREAIHLVDATSIRLADISRAWADYEAHGALVKLHVDFDADCEIPANFAITPARVNDVSMAHTLPVEPGATYVFDLGYYDFSWWARLHEAGCRIVTRLKTNTRPRVIETRAVALGGPVRSDQIIAIDGRLKSARGTRHPLDGITLREVAVVIDTGRTLRLVTNDLDAPAERIGELYKARWQVELFFRWVKQHLKIKRFLGTSENAIRTQIAVALIAFLILRIVHQAKAFDASLLTFARLVRANLMHIRPLDNLAQPPPPIRRDHRQAEFALC